MKFLKYIPILSFLFFISCADGYMDEIESREPGQDEEAPVVEIDFPTNGTLVRVVEEVTDIDIRFEATDDIFLERVELAMDGNNFATLTDFRDYRRVVEELVYEDLTNGPHTLTITATDSEGKSTSASVDFEKTEPYTAQYDGEIFYMPFDNEFLELLTLTPATEVGSPGFTSEAKVGTGAYQGAVGSYLTFPADNLTNSEFSAVFWYKLNADPNRAGILVMTPEGFDSPPETLNNGFKFFREAGGEDQRFKLNAGRGDGNSWFDGGEDADLNPAEATGWNHLAFTISETQNTVYINGEIVRQGDFPGISWEDVAVMSIMSGEPNFAHWNHLADPSQMDELRIFNRALSQEEIQQIIADES